MPLSSVLVVEDETSLRTTIMRFLHEEGYQVHGAADGQEAVRQLEQETPAIVVLDMYLPRLNGWEVARLMRERRIGSKIIVLTAAHSAKAVAEELRTDGYVSKPFALLRLLREVERLTDTSAV